MKAALLVVLLTLAGCAAPPPEQQYWWTRPYVTSEQAEQDLAQCQYQAATAMGGQPIPYGNTTALAMMLAQRRNIEGACMRAAGYAWRPRPS